MNTNFEDFINKLGRETVSSINKENKAMTRSMPDYRETIEEEYEEPKKESRRVEPKVESIRVEDKPESKKTESRAINEDFVEKALDYTRVIMKTVRQSFSTDEEKKLVFESIRNAINMYLGESSYQPHSNLRENRVEKVAPMKVMTEEEFEKIPVVENKGHTIKNNQNDNSEYKRDLKIPLNENNEVDLSHISNKDKNDLRVLMGLE